jgi:hypothetical protein
MVLMKLPMGDTYSASIYARLYVYLFVYIRTWNANILANSNTQFIGGPISLAQWAHNYSLLSPLCLSC